MRQGIGKLMWEGAKHREKKNELSHKTQFDPQKVKVLIDNFYFYLTFI